MQLTITRRLEFDAGHRIVGHEGKCRYLHGHRYAAEIAVMSPQLDALGRVIDFGAMKLLLGDWIDENWDHNLILSPEDPLLDISGAPLAAIGAAMGRPPYVLSGNPTAEHMAAELASIFQTLLNLNFPGCRVVHLRLYETPSCWADIYRV